MQSKYIDILGPVVERLDREKAFAVEAEMKTNKDQEINSTLHAGLFERLICQDTREDIQAPLVHFALSPMLSPDVHV